MEVGHQFKRDGCHRSRVGPILHVRNQNPTDHEVVGLSTLTRTTRRERESQQPLLVACDAKTNKKKKKKKRSEKQVGQAI